MKNSLLSPIIFPLLFLFFTSCQNDKNLTDKPSILILTIEGLNGSESLCPGEPLSVENSGFAALCRESVRFTHAFTSSPLSVPAIGSILTAQYPIENQLHDNSQYLSAKSYTISEMAYSLGYSTAFFSGGAPILRKTGLGQGFEIFYDYFSPSIKLVQESSSDVVEHFVQWMKKAHSPFFSVLYLPFFIKTEHFVDTPSKDFNNNLDEALFHLIQALKRNNKWNSTLIFMIGLNGKLTRENAAFPMPMNLHSENTQITFLLKPFRALKGGEGTSWTEDVPVSLPDIGSTIFELLEGRDHFKNFNEESLEFKKISFISLLNKPGNVSKEPRLIPTESAWGKWHFQLPIYFSFRFDHWLVFLEKPPRYYNTLTDKLEISPWSYPLKEYLFQDFHNQLEQYITEMKITSIDRSKEMMNLYQVLQADFWENPSLKEFRYQKMTQILKSNPLDPFFIPLMVHYFLENQLWKELKELGMKTHQKDWQNLAQYNMDFLSHSIVKNPTPSSGKIDVLKPPQNRKEPIEKNNPQNSGISRSDFSLLFSNPCIKLSFVKIIEKIQLSDLDLKTCQDPLILSYIRWTTKGSRSDFMPIYYYFLDKKIILSNLSFGMIWDVPQKSKNSLEPLEILLNLPEFQLEKIRILKEISSMK